MPNHIHGIIVIEHATGTGASGTGTSGTGTGTLQRAPTDAPTGAPTVEQFGRPTSDSIPTIVRLLKAATTKRINMARDLPGVPVWQGNYYERVVRNETDWNRIREYIANNPARWEDDQENPDSARRVAQKSVP